jgi:hypothetical protein
VVIVVVTSGVSLEICCTREHLRELRLSAMQQLNLWKKDLEEGGKKNGDATREKRRGE